MLNVEVIDMIEDMNHPLRWLLNACRIEVSQSEPSFRFRLRFISVTPTESHRQFQERE
jgi:hypothetical protein